MADRPESQDICFGDYQALVKSYASQDETVGGEVVDRSGKVLGQHAGIHGVTIGQRRGLGISASRPLYVVDIEAESKQVVVGTKKDLGCKGLIAEISTGSSRLTRTRSRRKCRSAIGLRRFRVLSGEWLREPPKFVSRKLVPRSPLGKRRSFIVAIDC